MQQGRITVDPSGAHTGDYYLFLSQLMKEYAQNMREQVHIVNPHFYIGAYPSPISKNYYLPEIFSGWSTPVKPAIVFGTETYYSGGAEKIPQGLNNFKQPAGYYNLTTIYPSHTSTDNPIYAYYVGGIIIMQDSPYYFSNDYAYHTYTIAKETNGYWVFTTYSLTEPFTTLKPYYRTLCYDTPTNSLIRCTDATLYAEEVQRYYNQMDLMHTELQKYLRDTDYVSPLAPTTPPPIVYERPEIINYPSLTPLQTPVDQLLTFTHQPILRELHHIILYAQQGQNAQFTLQYADVTTSIRAGLQYLITDYDKNIIQQGYMNYLNNQKTISFIAPYTGCYLLSAHSTWHGCFHILDTNIPMAVYTNPELHSFTSIKSDKYTIYFWVGTESQITLKIRGQNQYEGAKVAIYRPSAGDYTLHATGTTTPSQIEITVTFQIPSESQQKIWRVEITKPLNQILEDVWISSSEKNIFYFTDNPRYVLS